MNAHAPSTGCDPFPANAKPVRILHLTDFHFLPESGEKMLGIDTELSFAATLAAALSAGPRPDLALLTGDLVQTPTITAYRRLKTRLVSLPFPCYCLPGNHDDPPLMGEILMGEGPSCQPRVALDRWQIICLNSVVAGQPHGRLGEGQLERLAALLDEVPQRYALIALHHHPVPSGSRWMDTMMVENAERLFSVLEPRSQARGVIFGHIHQVMDVQYRGLRLMSTPSTCFQFKPNQVEFTLDPIPPGYRWIELYPDGSIASGVERLKGLRTGAS